MNIIITSAIVILASVVGYASYKIWGADNKVEETCETIIKDTTGDTVDLSPTEDGATGAASSTTTTNNENK